MVVALAAATDSWEIYCCKTWSL